MERILIVVRAWKAGPVTRYVMRLAAAAATIILLGAMPSPASAASGIGVQAVEMKCNGLYAATAYGPIGWCTQKFGNTARAGYYVAASGVFDDASGWRTILDWRWHQDLTVRATDGHVGQTQGHGVLDIQFGPTVYATQYRNTPPGTPWQVRFGTWNLYTNLFYPSTGWWPHSNCQPVECPPWLPM